MTNTKTELRVGIVLDDKDVYGMFTHDAGDAAAWLRQEFAFGKGWGARLTANVNGVDFKRPPRKLTIEKIQLCTT